MTSIHTETQTEMFERESAKILELDPNECIVWDGNPRKLEKTPAEKQSELIADILADGRQLVPAIVRKCNSGAASWEIIAGSRRHAAIQWIRENKDPEFMFRAEAVSLTDEQAFRVSITENSDRIEPSPFETALALRDALARHYAGNQAAMAERLGISESYVSRLISISNLPMDCFEAIPRWHDVTVRKALQLAEAHKKNENRFLKSLEKIKTLKESDPTLSTSHVLATLLPKTKGKETGKAYGPAKQPHLRVKRSIVSELTITIPRHRNMDLDKEGIVSSFAECLTEWAG